MITAKTFMPHRVFDSTAAMLLGWGAVSGSTFGMLLAKAEPHLTDGLGVISAIPDWLIAVSWGLSSVAVTVGALATAYKRVQEGNALIREAENRGRMTCTFPDDCRYKTMRMDEYSCND